MSKQQTIFVCSKCDAQSLKWAGRCSECGAWGTMQEADASESAKPQRTKVPAAKMQDFADLRSDDQPRIITGINELDRVLGGGMVPGSLVLLGGEPGIGKSTLVAQWAGALRDKQVAYASGEESAQQVKGRMDRLQIRTDHMKFMGDTSIERIIAAADEARPSLLIVDSIQTMSSDQVESEAGSVSQIRAGAVKLLELAKRTQISVVIIGHITKDGTVAGPKTLEHIVDTVLYLEADEANGFRLLRASKNRFGSINELGIFFMDSKGLQEVSNPSAIFIEKHDRQISGSAISSVLEGSRTFLAEVQALVTKTVFGYPQRKAAGFDLNRLQVLIAVINKRTKINLTAQDVIMNIAGGLKASDTALDLAVCAAIISSLNNINISGSTIFLGEVGLGGEVRPVARLNERLNEAAKLGFRKAVVPEQDTDVNKIELKKIRSIDELNNLLAQ